MHVKDQTHTHVQKSLNPMCNAQIDALRKYGEVSHAEGVRSIKYKGAPKQRTKTCNLVSDVSNSKFSSCFFTTVSRNNCSIVSSEKIQ